MCEIGEPKKKRPTKTICVGFVYDRKHGTFRFYCFEN